MFLPSFSQRQAARHQKIKLRRTRVILQLYLYIWGVYPRLLGIIGAYLVNPSFASRLGFSSIGLLFSLYLSTAQGQSVPASLPPVKTYYVGKDDRRIGIAERWTEDENGLRHGTYLRYNKQGLVSEKCTYVHGNKTGPGRLYHYSLSEFYYGDSGSYRNGAKVGEWVAINREGERTQQSIYGTDGRLIKVTYYKDGQPIRIVNHKPVAASTTTVAITSPNNFYYFLPAEKAQFQELVYRTGESRLTGPDLMKSGLLDDPAKFVYIINQNNGGRHIELLLKQCKALGMNPIKRLMEAPTLEKFTISALASLQSPQVDGEMLYYGLRGMSPEYGTVLPENVKYFIRYRHVELSAYKKALESHFYAAARAAKDAHADSRVYPLRWWLFEAFGEDTDLINRITPPTPQD